MALEAAERLGAVLAAHGFRTTEVDGPGFLPALALSPGCPPLLRSLVLTSDSVAARMLPCLGTPFADIRAPLVGVNVLNGTPGALLRLVVSPTTTSSSWAAPGRASRWPPRPCWCATSWRAIAAVVIDPELGVRRR